MSATQISEVSPFIGKTVSFNVHPSQQLPFSFSRVRIDGLVSISDVNQNIMNPNLMHRRVYATLPAGVPDDASSYMYLKLTFPDASVYYVGIPWIVTGTIAVVQNSVYTVRIEDDRVDIEALIKSVLTGGGITNVSITKV